MFEHRILKRLDDIMTALSDLADAVTANTTANDAAVVALASGTPGSDDSAIETAVAQINANTAALNAATTPPALPADTTSDTPNAPAAPAVAETVVHTL